MQHTVTTQTQMPSAGASLFAYFFGVVKSKASAGRDPRFSLALERKSHGCRPGPTVLVLLLDICGIELPGTATKNKRPHRIYLSPVARRLISKPGKGLIVTKNDGEQIPVYILSS